MVGVTGSIPVPPTIPVPPNQSDFSLGSIPAPFPWLAEACLSLLSKLGRNGPQMAADSALESLQRRILVTHHDGWIAGANGRDVRSGEGKRRRFRIRGVLFVCGLAVDGQRGSGSSTQQQRSLFIPVRGQGAGLAQSFRCQRCRMVAGDDALDDIRSKEGQRDQAADVGPVDACQSRQSRPSMYWYLTTGRRTIAAPGGPSRPASGVVRVPLCRQRREQASPVCRSASGDWG